MIRIFAVTGLIGSGKDEVAHYICRTYHFTLLDHSEILGKTLERMGRPPSREEKRALRLERGNLFTAEMILQEIRELALQKVVIGSLRRPEEYEITKKAYPQAQLLVVEADQKIRFERLIKRDRDRPTDWENFLETDRKEEEIYHFQKTFSYADFFISNNSSFRDLYRRIDHIMKL